MAEIGLVKPCDKIKYVILLMFSISNSIVVPIPHIAQPGFHFVDFQQLKDILAMTTTRLILVVHGLNEKESDHFGTIFFCFLEIISDRMITQMSCFLDCLHMLAGVKLCNCSHLRFSW